MTATIDTATDETPAPDAQTPAQPDAAGDGAAPAPLPGGRPMIATALLTAHPGNVRADIDLDQEFLDSIGELGVRTPLLITPAAGGLYRVIDGHRRLAAAVHHNLPEVPYDLDAGREADEAGQFLDMYATNHHRKGLSKLEEADALFAASEYGASQRRIRKATGLSPDEVASALKAGRMTGYARETAAAFGGSLKMDQLALLAEFDDDDEAVSQIMNEISYGRSGQYAAERLRQERADQAARQELMARLAADGYQIAAQFPDLRQLLTYLAHDGQDLTPEAHAACPGRAVHVSDYSPPALNHYCADPDANGHESRLPASDLPDLRESAEGADDAGTPPAPGTAPSPDSARKLVIEGNKAWTAAASVRRRWLADSLLARPAAPKEAMPFITAELLAMPDPVRDVIGRASRSTLFAKITGGAIRHDQDTSTWKAGRHPIALLAVIAACYEDRMDGDQGKYTWRTDRHFTQCPRKDAGAYFRFLASVGHELSPIEQAVADDIPYAGDQPADDPAAMTDADATPDDAAAGDGDPGRGEADGPGAAPQA